MKTLLTRVYDLKQEWADAGDDVPEYLQVINELCKRLHEMNHAASTLPSLNNSFVFALSDLKHLPFGEDL